MNQKTIISPVSCVGISLHLGLMSKIEFFPALSNAGIYFIHNGEKIAADCTNVSNTLRETSLKNISTVEHVLSAIYGIGIDNIEIHIDNTEPPALDGSAIKYIELLKSAGLRVQDVQEEYIAVKNSFSIKESGSEISIEPASHLIIDASVDFPNTFIGVQNASFDERKDDYEKEIAPARTFGFMKEVEALKKNHLALGASLDNAIAILDNGYSCPLRFSNELARHKILDIMGDIALAGKRIKGKIVSKKGSHSLNIALIRRLIND